MNNYSSIPSHMREGLKLYVERGIEPGSFLMAILCNDLKSACAAADSINRYRIFDFVDCLYNETPMDCWGSPEKVRAWMDLREKEIRK